MRLSRRLSSFVADARDRFIKWVAHNAMHNNMINSRDEVTTSRYHFLWPDEYWSDSHGLVNARPWYLPFNAFLHCWHKSDDGLPHDHPRWSITILLKGRMVEETPTTIKWLTPGAVVFRRASAIHRFDIPTRYQGDTWTIFIVGRRRRWQHYYTDFTQRAERFR